MDLNDLSRIQEIGKEILFDIVDICEKHNIQYYLAFGTLLGAIRHSGPIPWDDDIDIAMTRENYNRFLEIARTELDVRNEIVMMGPGTHHYISELKIGRKGTLYCMPGSEQLDIMSMVQVDIFLLDSIKKKGKLCWGLKKFLKYVALSEDEADLLRMAMENSNHRWKMLYKIGFELVRFCRIFLSEERIERFIYKMFVDCDGTSDYLGIAMEGQESIFLKTDFAQTCTALFSGRELLIPSGYEHILSTTYGNYMEFPPEDKRYRKDFDKWIFKEEL